MDGKAWREGARAREDHFRLIGQSDSVSLHKPIPSRGRREGIRGLNFRHCAWKACPILFVARTLSTMP